MTSNRFFINKKQIKFPLIHLSGAEHFHLNKVVRKRAGDKVWLFDKTGTSYLAKIEKTDKSQTKLLILKVREKNDPHVRIALAQTLIKSKALDFVIQKTTELGIMKFIPVLSYRTIIKIENKIDKKLIRWKKIAIEAAKQCGRSDLPSIKPPVALEKLLEEESSIKKIFLNENSGTLLRDIIRKESPDSILVLVGPEGGWTDEEEKNIIDHDYEPVNLGANILRTETAAVCSIGILAHYWNT